MEKIGLLIEIKDGEVKPANLGVLTAARGADHDLHVFLLDGDVKRHRAVLENFGAHKIVDIRCEEGALTDNPACRAAAVVEAMEHFDIHTLAGLASARGKDLLARIAAGLGAPLVLDCIRFDLAAHTAEKSQYSGKTIARIQLRGSHAIYGLRPKAVEAQPAPGRAEVVSLTATCPASGLEFIQIRQQTGDAIDLTEADVIISGGRGMKDAQNFKILFECAATMGAAVGASRVAVEAGWVPYSMQVGQTGATVSPKVYLACGISGSVQHFAGMKTARTIIAVNQDPDAAITRTCDYFAVADLFDIIPRLTRRLRQVQKLER